MVEQVEKKLIFVYNADSGGVFTGLKDTLHKTFRKSTYQCNLCAVTFGAFRMKKEWKKFVNDLDVPVEFKKKDKFQFEFLHKDEFDEKYKVKNAKFPSAYYLDGKKMEIFISQDEMNVIKSIDELKELVNKKIDEFGL
ncbi:MAG: hypothetical protein ACFFD5_09285 [Candidatus Thorarchaeota archaeon]